MIVRDIMIEARLVADAMTTPAVTIASGRPVSDAATTLLEHGIDRLPVVHSGRLVGIVTRGDLVRAFIRSDEAIADVIRNDVVMRRAWASPGAISVSVAGGQVVLEGHADFRGSRGDSRRAHAADSRRRRGRIAAELARTGSGVRCWQ